MARLTLSWLQVINLLGAIQGLVLAGALVTKRSNRTANRLLAATMVAFSIYLVTDVYHATLTESPEGKSKEPAFNGAVPK